jgi:predicted regulator of Ras-like GTPase activity (Roadblock/LC7/MglB family)
MWRAFQLAEPELGQPKANQRGGTQLPKLGQAVMTPDANRFEMPIQQRQKDPAAVAAAAAGKADPSMFDIPIQERMKMQQQAAPEGQWGAAPQPPAPPSPPPAPPAMQAPQPMQAPPAPPAPGGLPTKNSIMDRLNKVLGDDLEAMAAGPGMKAPPPAPQVAAPATPAYNAAQAAEPPVPPPAPPAPARPDASQFDVPIQERAKQAQEPAPVAAATGGAGLFKLDDNAIDRVFSENLGVKEVARPVGVEAPAAPPAPPPAPAMPAVPPRPAVPPAVPGSPAGMTPPMPAVAAAPPAASGGAPRISAIPPRPGAAAPVPAAPAAPAAPGAADSSGLFKPLDDRAVDQIFSNLGVKEEAAPVQAAAHPPAPAPAAPPACPPLPPMPGMPGAVPPAMPAAGAAPPAGGYAPAPQPAAKQQGSGLINVDDDAMDRIFEHLGVKDKPAATVQPPKINVREVVQQIRTLADVPAPPQVPGISRLSREEAAAQPAAGKINAIGKFLLDQQDLAKIGQLTEQDLSDTKVRVLTHEASDEINRLLEHIASQPGVVGSVIVGHDGILIANSLPKEHDPETIGILSLGIYINTTNTSKKMGHNYLHQLVCRTHHGYLVIADFGGGILVTVSNAHETEKLIPLMRNITQLVAQS